ncbi:MAG TPA: hypothetical protein VEU30_15275, partial [Thermoanaerobaculia bacterium]|nr:hypothetical protein [Thermoanaerobaculia bacterium]
MNDKAVLSLALQDVEGRVITDARVGLARVAETDVTALRFDEQQGLFVSEPVDPGQYVVTVDAEDYVTETVPLRLTPPGVTTTVMLGREGQPYYVVSGRRTYYPATDMMAALMRAPAEGEPRERAEQMMRDLGAADVEPIERREPGQPMIVTFPREAAARALQLQAEREIPEVMDAGPVVYAHGSDVRFLSREIEVVTVDGVSRERLEELVRPFGLHVARQSHGDPRIFTVAAVDMPGPDHGVLPGRLMELPEVRRATSKIAALIQDTAITPADVLFPLQYYAVLTRCPEAWELVRSPAAPESFGSADIIIAVTDRGITTMTTGAGVSTATHPAFSGTVTGGTLSALLGSS